MTTSNAPRSALAAAALALAAGLALAGCSRDKPAASGAAQAAAVAQRTRDFLEALRGPDPEAVKPLLTEKARGNFAKFGKRMGRVGAGETYEVGDPTLDGDTARSPVTLKEAGRSQTLVVRLRKEAGEWRVTGFEAPLMGDGVTVPAGQEPPLLVFDFEDPDKFFREMFGGLGKELEGGFKKMGEAMAQGFEDSFGGKPTDEDRQLADLRPLTPDDFDKTSREDLAAADRPAREVLEQLAVRRRLKLVLTPFQEKSLAKPVAVNLTGKSFWELVEEVTRQAGVYPTYDIDYAAGGPVPTLKLQPRPRPFPVAFAGPFLVESELREFAPHAVGNLQLTRVGFELPKTIQPLQPRFDRLKVERIVDAKGRDLRDPDGAGGGSMERQGLDAWSWSHPLKDLLRDVTEIREIQGSVRVVLPAAVDSLAFDKLEPKQERKAGAITVALDRVSRRPTRVNEKEYPSTSLTFKIKGAGADRVKFVAHDAQGGLVRVSQEFSSSFGDQAEVSIRVGGEPARVTAKVLTKVHEIDYPVLFEKVALAEAGRQPEKLEPAKFAGPAPITLAFVKLEQSIGKQDAQFRVTNHADKDVRLLDLDLDYLDAAGKKLRDWKGARHRAPPTLPLREVPVLVRKGETAVLGVHAPFLPKEAVAVVATLKKVGFVDATEWAAPGGKK